jgi:hypothetical protein
VRAPRRAPRSWRATFLTLLTLLRRSVRHRWGLLALREPEDEQPCPVPLQDMGIGSEFSTESFLSLGTHLRDAPEEREAVEALKEEAVSAQPGEILAVRAPTEWTVQQVDGLCDEGEAGEQGGQGDEVPPHDEAQEVDAPEEALPTVGLRLSLARKWSIGSPRVSCLQEGATADETERQWPCKVRLSAVRSAIPPWPDALACHVRGV